jgi:hypothetical protein
MKAIAANLVLAAVVLAVAGAGAQERPDLTGTWIGTTLVPDVGEDVITLELTREGDTYTGRGTDAAKVVVAPEIKNVAFAEGTLTFDIGVSGGADNVTVHISLRVDGDQTTGQWATDEGESTGLTLARKAG